MRWRDLIAESYKAREQGPGLASRPEFHPGASDEAIDQVEDRLGVQLPGSLRSLLAETDGVTEWLQVGGEWVESIRLIWSVAELDERNRSRPRGPGEMIFFADAGCDGILLGFPVLDGGDCGPGVRTWRPIEERSDDLAPTLDEFLRGWIGEEIVF